MNCLIDLHICQTVNAVLQFIIGAQVDRTRNLRHFRVEKPASF